MAASNPTLLSQEDCAMATSLLLFVFKGWGYGHPPSLRENKLRYESNNKKKEKETASSIITIIPWPGWGYDQLPSELKDTDTKR